MTVVGARASPTRGGSQRGDKQHMIALTSPPLYGNCVPAESINALQEDAIQAKIAHNKSALYLDVMSSSNRVISRLSVAGRSHTCPHDVTDTSLDKQKLLQQRAVSSNCFSCSCWLRSGRTTLLIEGTRGLGLYVIPSCRASILTRQLAYNIRRNQVDPDKSTWHSHSTIQRR